MIFPEMLNNIKGPKTASQAYDEGSIPFTRSNDFNALCVPSKFIWRFFCDKM
jgi:hypothetical protein